MHDVRDRLTEDEQSAVLLLDRWLSERLAKPRVRALWAREAAECLLRLAAGELERVIPIPCPEPGSKPARRVGCVCLAEENGHGMGAYGGRNGPDGRPIYVTARDCPLHGDDLRVMRRASR